MARIIADVVRILQAAREVRRQLDKLHGAALDPVRRDVAPQIGRLVFPGFITRHRAPGGCPTSSATCAAPPGGWSA